MSAKVSSSPPISEADSLISPASGDSSTESTSSTTETKTPSSRLVRLERLFQTNLSLVYLEIENESFHHANHYVGDGETHWRVLVVAPEFRGLSRLQRHQKINQWVQAEWENGLHALALQVYDPEEWEKRKASKVHPASS